MSVAIKQLVATCCVQLRVRRIDTMATRPQKRTTPAVAAVAAAAVQQVGPASACHRHGLLAALLMNSNRCVAKRAHGKRKAPLYSALLC